MKTLVVLVLGIGVLVARAHAAAETIELWPEGVPGLRADAAPENDDGNGRYTNIHYPSLVVYRPPAGTENGTAILYAPGGGYSRVAGGVNGGVIARWLNPLGITVYLLKYRHAPYTHPAPLQDATRAMRLLRSRAPELGIKHLGMLGGSAGGHLTALTGALHAAPEARTGAALDAVSARPDFLVLIFSMISVRDVPTGRRGGIWGDTGATDELKARLSVENHVTADTPPTFLVHSAEDRVVPVENSLAFYAAMRRAGAPIEMHLFTRGPHGDGMSPEHGPISQWPRLCEEWMRANGWLPKPSAEISP